VYEDLLSRKYESRLSPEGLAADFYRYFYYSWLTLNTMPKLFARKGAWLLGISILDGARGLTAKTRV
jgi:hypothetical protein